MKKIIFLTIALLIMISLPVTNTYAHTEEEPFRVELLAGQTEDIGHINVWNDGEMLYVKFVYDGPDCGFMEVHLQVDEGGWDEDILTKKGNPIPGQFEASYKGGCFKTHTFSFNLSDEGFDFDDELMIAAHAALGQEMTMTVASQENTATVYGPMNHYAGPESSDWGTGKLAPETWVHENWATVAGAKWISSYAGEYPEGWSDDVIEPDSWRWFRHEFSVPGSVKEATLVANADNAEDIYVNSILVATDGEVQGDIDPTDEWGYVEDVGFVDILEGTNVLDFVVRNYPADTADQRNPTALAYKLDITYYLGGDSAWGEGDLFVDKGNWATYFTYNVQAPPLTCPEITVKSDNIELLDSPPTDVSVGALENDNYVRVWKEFEGQLSEDLAYDLEEGRSAKFDGPAGTQMSIKSGTDVCVYYVHLDNEGESSTVDQTGSIQFETDISGLIISGGDIGDFQNRDLMFAADEKIGYSDTIYPGLTKPDYLRGFDVNHYGNLDDAKFSGNTVNFTMWVIEAHDSMRVILPLVP